MAKAIVRKSTTVRPVGHDQVLDWDETLNQVDKIVREHRLGYIGDDLVKELRDLLEDAMTIANSEGYSDGFHDGHIGADK